MYHINYFTIFWWFGHVYSSRTVLYEKYCLKRTNARQTLSIWLYNAVAIKMIYHRMEHLPDTKLPFAAKKGFSDFSHNMAVSFLPLFYFSLARFVLLLHFPVLLHNCFLFPLLPISSSSSSDFVLWSHISHYFIWLNSFRSINFVYVLRVFFFFI